MFRGGPGSVRSARLGKAWDFELPDSPAELAGYWEAKAVIAEDQAALCAGPEAVAWRNMAEAWREAARKAGASRYEQTLHVLIRHDAAGNGRPD